MDIEKMKYHMQRLQPGEIYWDSRHQEQVEFGYMGKTGLAIVSEPGDSGGMQSSWGLDPDCLERIMKE
jgi:hypothetical protein